MFASIIPPLPWARCLAGVVRLVRFHPDRAAPRVKLDNEEAQAPPPSNRTATVSAGLLFAALVAIVGLAKSLTLTLEIGVARLDVPKPVVGIVIATLVLLPEGLAALRAARANPGIGIRTREHWPDHPGGCWRFNRDSSAARARAGDEGPGPAGIDAAHWRDHVGHRPNYRASGHRTLGHLRGLFVLCCNPVMPTECQLLARLPHSRTADGLPLSGEGATTRRQDKSHPDLCYAKVLSWSV
jgi:hypothetical protein